MKTKALLILGISIFFATAAFGLEQKCEGKTLSPYFFVKSDAPDLDQLPLKGTKVKVNIAGVIAKVEIRQVYKNEGEKTIEAVYVFPLGTRAAIHRMQMKIGDRTIEAKIEKRETAKREYEAAKKEGKSASLLEQQRPNVFQMNVANIMPQDTVEVSIGFTELIVPEEGIYEFVFPTVVGPRYSNIAEEEAGSHDRWIKTPYLHEKEAPAYGFDIEANILSGLPIAKISVPSHKVNTDWQGKDHVFIRLDPSETKGSNRDFILRYSLQGKKLNTGLLLYPGDEENFFLLLVQPPEKISDRDIPTREYVFIVDVSGSMKGFPLSVSKALIKKIINDLKEDDYLNILFFSAGSATLSDRPIAANRENKKRALAMLECLKGGGGTELLPALKRAFSLPKREGLSRIVVVATDGYVRVEKEAFDIIRDNLGQGNVFTFGIGKAVNRHLIEGMARAGAGEAFVVSGKAEAVKMANRFIRYVTRPILTDIAVSFSGFDAYDVEPLSFPDLFAERPLAIFGKYYQAAGKIALTGKVPGGSFEKEISLSPTDENKSNSALRYLWARWRLERLSDYRRMEDPVREEITEIGLRYNLMTGYTSFIAIDTLVRETGEVVTVKQPLHLPEGVSDSALPKSGGKGLAFYNALPRSYVEGLARRKLSLIGPQEKIYRLGKEKAKDGADFHIVCSDISQLSKSEILMELSQLSKDVQDLLKEFGLKKIALSLDLIEGKVINIKVQDQKDKRFVERLHKLFAHLLFPVKAAGKIQLQIFLTNQRDLSKKKTSEDVPLSAKKKYCIQIASVKERRTASRLIQELINKGYAAYYQKVSHPKGIVYYRVRVGHWSEKSEAREKLRLIQAKMGVRGFVVRIDSERNQNHPSK